MYKPWSERLEGLVEGNVQKYLVIIQDGDEELIKLVQMVINTLKRLYKVQKLCFSQTDLIFWLVLTEDIVRKA